MPESSIWAGDGVSPEWDHEVGPFGPTHQAPYRLMVMRGVFFATDVGIRVRYGAVSGEAGTPSVR